MRSVVSSGDSDSDIPQVIAHTKLVPPPLHEWAIRRPRLLRGVLASPVRLCVITGPAGAGKSMALAELHDAAPIATWLSLDRTDNDPVVLCWSLVESLRECFADFGDRYRHRLTTGGPAVVDEVVASIANELEHRGEPVRLVIDDVGLVEDADARRVLHTLARLLPDCTKMTIASRERAPIPLARLRVAGELLELDGHDLALTVDEADELLANRGVELERELVAELVDRTEGWPAGLQLAAMVLAASDARREFITRFHGTDRAVAEFLIAEVLDGIDPDRRTFMVETGLLERMSGDLCDAVTGRTGSTEVLRQLEQANAFVVPLDRDGRWFRYHHLFADLLVAELARRPSDEVAELHARASAWHRDHGHLTEAVCHALAAGQRRVAADLVCAGWWPLVSAGQVESARALICEFEDEEVASHQPLAIAAAFVAAFAGEHNDAKRLVRIASASSYEGEPPDGAASMKSSLAIMCGALAVDGVAAALVDGELAYGLEPVTSPWRSFAALVIGLARAMSDDMDGATPFFEEASSSPDDPVRAYALAELSLGQLARGECALAVDTACAAQQLVDDRFEDHLAAAVTYAARARTALAVGDDAAARVALYASERPMRSLGQAMPMDTTHAHLLLAEVAIDLEEHDLARSHITAAQQVTRTISDTGAMAEQLEVLGARLDDVAAHNTSPQPDEEPLTARELEVLALLPLALTTREIGEELYLSRNTVKTYLRRLYRKLGASARAEAVALARQQDLLPPC